MLSEDKFPICVQSSNLFPLKYVSDAINFKDHLLRQLNELVSTGGEQNNGNTMKLRGARGSVVGCYKPEGRGFESR
jgi:hypothetical protein